MAISQTLSPGAGIGSGHTRLTNFVQVIDIKFYVSSQFGYRQWWPHAQHIWDYYR